MKVIQIYPSLADVFTGDGWENWSRWKRAKGVWFQIGGNKIEHSALILKQLCEKE